MNMKCLNAGLAPKDITPLSGRIAGAVILPLLCLLLAGGCATPQSENNKEAKGTRQVFPATFNTVWEAAMASAYTGDLLLSDFDRKTGQIWATRHIDAGSFGERVIIRVTSLSPGETAVEVESHLMGPPFITARNWEKPVLRNITFMLDE